MSDKSYIRIDFAKYFVFKLTEYFSNKPTSVASSLDQLFSIRLRSVQIVFITWHLLPLLASSIFIL
jgi:hypothetical protein